MSLRIIQSLTECDSLPPSVPLPPDRNLILPSGRVRELRSCEEEAKGLSQGFVCSFKQEPNQCMAFSISFCNYSIYDRRSYVCDKYMKWNVMEKRFQLAIFFSLARRVGRVGGNRNRWNQSSGKGNRRLSQK